jgi:SAM-dependent methyltransferase
MARREASPVYEPESHILIAPILTAHSTNRNDIRRVIRDALPSGRPLSVLDLGCGYGFLYEALPGFFAAGSTVLGIDGNPQNEPHFLARVAASGAEPAFRCTQLPAPIDLPDGSFELVLSIFSLYFFPRMLPEIRRLLRPGGLFVAVTHCTSSFAELNAIIGDDRVFGVLSEFNDRNGPSLLAPHFASVGVVPYPNRLVFARSDWPELQAYLRFKRPDWMSDATARWVLQAVRSRLRQGELVVSKDDVVFMCRSPR